MKTKTNKQQIKNKTKTQLGKKGNKQETNWP